MIILQLTRLVDPDYCHAGGTSDVVPDVTITDGKNGSARWDSGTVDGVSLRDGVYGCTSARREEGTAFEWG